MKAGRGAGSGGVQSLPRAGGGAVARSVAAPAAASGAPVRGTGTSRGGVHRHGAHDILFDHDVARAADHQQMLDIVAPHQHEAATAVDRRGIDHGKARLAPALRGGADARGAEAANEPERQPDQGEHDHERDDEAYDQRPFGAEQTIHLRSPLPPPGLVLHRARPCDFRQNNKL